MKNSLTNILKIFLQFQISEILKLKIYISRIKY